MLRLSKTFGLAVVLLLPRIAVAQNQQAISAVKAVANEWTRAYNAHDVNAVVAVFDKPVGLFVFGSTAVPLDSLKAMHTLWFSQRTDEQWTNDRVDVVMLGDQSALFTITQSGHFTLVATGVARESKSSAFVTALVQKRGNAWKVVAAHVSSGSTQVKK